MNLPTNRTYPVPGFPVRVESIPDWIRATWLTADIYAFWLPALLATARFRPGRLASIERNAARHVARRLRMHIETAGLGHIDPDRRYLVAPLHESLVDPLALASLPMDLTYAVRSEFLDWFGLGSHLRNRPHIPTDPEHPVASVRRLIAGGAATLANGENLVVFPQGSILGIELRFHPAPFRLAARLGIEVLPIVLTGGHRIWEHPFSPRLRLNRPVHMTVLAPRRAPTTQPAVDALAAEMRSIALRQTDAPVRRFDPERDGYWDGYAFEIDPAFPGLREQIAAHRRRPPRSDGGQRPSLGSVS